VPEKILVVEDDVAIVEGLTTALRTEGYEVEAVREGRRGLERALSGTADLLILDVMLPGMGGMEIVKRLRDGGSTLPVILLTAKGEEDDRVLGLELGADDYVTKPFSVRELMARVRSTLRRVHASYPRARFTFGDVVVDFKRQSVTKRDAAVELSAREFRILAYFIEHAGELLTRERLLNDIWGYDVFPTTRTVDNHLARLRKKLEDAPESPRHLLTVRGAGYVFEPEGGNGHAG